MSQIGGVLLPGATRTFGSRARGIAFESFRRLRPLRKGAAPTTRRGSPGVGPDPQDHGKRRGEHPHTRPPCGPPARGLPDFPFLRRATVLIPVLLRHRVEPRDHVGCRNNSGGEELRAASAWFSTGWVDTHETGKAARFTNGGGWRRDGNDTDNMSARAVVGDAPHRLDAMVARPPKPRSKRERGRDRGQWAVGIVPAGPRQRRFHGGSARTFSSEAGRRRRGGGVNAAVGSSPARPSIPGPIGTPGGASRSRVVPTRTTGTKDHDAVGVGSRRANQACGRR